MATKKQKRKKNKMDEREKKTSTYMPIRWNDIVESLKTYRKITGKNDFISQDYVISSTTSFPSHLHGLNLGHYLGKIRHAYRKGKLSTSQINALVEHQIHWEYDSYRFNFICLPALDMFKNIHGHLKVPVQYPSFVVPFEQNWPENLWGVKLGGQVNRWRSEKDTLPLHVVQALDEREFVWNVDEEDFQTITIPALKAYRELKGNLLVPQSFKVPSTDQWPTIMHGYKLGALVSRLRVHRGINSTKDEILDAMDFTWEPTRYQFETVMLPACKMYVQLNGDLNTVPKSYRVPKTQSLYPIECRGYLLGKRLHRWRVFGARPDFLEEIKVLGFIPDPVSFSHQDLTTLLQGLKWFYITAGHKGRVSTHSGTSTCLPQNHLTMPGLKLGELFSRAKKWDETFGFSDADRKKLNVFVVWNPTNDLSINGHLF